jgi:two-component system, OmpR family, sensor histidine kinase MprB
MALRRRVGLAAAAAVAVAVILVAIVCYWVVRGQLRGQVDDSLRAQASAIARGAGLDQPFPGLPASAGGPAPYVQVVLGDGTVFHRQGDISLPVTKQVLGVAGGGGSTYMTDVRQGGSHLRELAFPIATTFEGQPVAVQLARPLNGVDHVLSKLRLVLLLLSAAGIALAAVLGRLAARRVLSPLAEVADTAQHIGETEDLTARIRVHADDEVGQLATRFNAMLARLESSRAALDESVRAQRQLVADASHELRTPVTSLRTNIEVLLQDEHLGQEERRRMMTDVVEQTEELGGLVNDLIELARGDLPSADVQDVHLDQVVAESVDRATRNFPHVRFVPSLDPVLVEGTPERLGRAVNNLLDNAARHSPPDGVVEVSVDRDGLRVRDHGPGVAEEDRPFVFDRFYRGEHTRSQQGSGLGLAIVRQVATQHGGSVSVDNAADGGAVFTVRLPTLPPAESGSGRADDAGLARGPEALA